MKQLKALLITFSLIGCANAPVKPSIEICLIDYDRQECVCGFTSEQSTLNQLVQTKVQRYPLEYCHKATSIRPEYWEIFMNYLHQLEDYAKNRCK